VLALITADGEVISQVAGADVRGVDSRQLLDPHYVGRESGAPITYQRSVGATTYLVYLSTVMMTIQPAPRTAPTGGEPPRGTIVQPPGAVQTSGAGQATRMTALAAQSLRSVDDTVRTLLVITLTASALGLVLAVTVGLVVTGRALRPLGRMTATAQAIAVGGDGA